jgi:hypothetical protein
MQDILPPCKAKNFFDLALSLLKAICGVGMNRSQGFTSERLQASQFFILTDTFNMCHPSYESMSSGTNSTCQTATGVISDTPSDLLPLSEGWEKDVWHMGISFFVPAASEG